MTLMNESMNHLAVLFVQRRIQRTSWCLMISSREQRWRETWDQQNMGQWHCLQSNVSPLDATKSNISAWSVWFNPFSSLPTEQTVQKTRLWQWSIRVSGLGGKTARVSGKGSYFLWVTASISTLGETLKIDTAGSYSALFIYFLLFNS